jgi:organic hydroperoxide reductase OsmC/OhrA
VSRGHLARAALSGGFVRLARVDPELEQPPEAFARLGLLVARVRVARQVVRHEPYRVVDSSPAVAAEVALVLGERPQTLHIRTVGRPPDDTGTLRAVTTKARVLQFDVSVDRDRTSRSGLGGAAIPMDDGWWAEHLVLAGLARCTLTSLDYHAHRANLTSAGSASARGVVTQRESDGRYAFVDFEVTLDVELEPVPDEESVLELISKAERDCFVGSSLTARPRYAWTVNGEALP